MSTVLKTTPFPVLHSAAAPAKPSWWLWVPWVWLFFAATRTPSTWLEWGKGTATASEEGTGSPLDRLIMTSLMLLGLIVLGIRWEQTKRLIARNKCVVALFVYMGLTILWSNFPGISFRRWNRSLGTLEMVLIILTERNVREAVRFLLRRLYLVHTAGSIIAIKYFRSLGVVYNWSGSEEEWVGLTTDKNSLGQVVMCSSIFYLWQIPQDWAGGKVKRHLGVLILNVMLLGGTLWMLRGSKNIRSSTAIVGSAICAVILLGLQFLKKRKARAKRIILGATLGLALLAPCIYLVSAILNLNPFQKAVGATGRDMTFTDRTLIWKDVLSDTKKTAVLGVGIGAFWVGPIGYDLYPMPNWSLKTPEWRPEEGHNGFIDAYAELGAIGLVLLLIVIGAGFVGALNELEKDFELSSLRLVLLVGIILNNITETSFLKGTHDLWFLFLLMAMNVPASMSKASSANLNFWRRGFLGPKSKSTRQAQGCLWVGPGWKKNHRSDANCERSQIDRQSLTRSGMACSPQLIYKEHLPAAEPVVHEMGSGGPDPRFSSFWRRRC